MNKFISVPALGLSCAISCPAIAAQSALEEIIVTSSRVPMPLRQIGTSVSVVSAEEIEALGFNSLHDILRTQPAISVTNTGGAGKATSLRIRGEEGFRTLVLLDGIDISDTSGPQVAPRIEQLMSSGVERVEILRGPQGLMYGADAGGVVNITSATPGESFSGDLSIEGGRYGTRQLAGSIGGAVNGFDAVLSVTDFETDGFNATSTDTNPADDDGYENTTLHGLVGWDVTDLLRLQLVAHDIDSENEYDDCFTVDTFAPTNLCDDTFEQQSWRASADLQLGSFGHQLSYNDNSSDRQFYSEGQPSFGAEGELQKLSYLGSYDGGDALKLVYGIDLENESMDDGGFDTDRDQDGYYLEYQGSFASAFYVTAGARYDDNEDFGTHTSWRVSGAYLLPVAGGELKFKGSWGTGFRAPSLYEIAYNDSDFAYPPASDTDLKEESSEGYDLGLAWYGPGGTLLEAVYFDQRIEDEIYFDLATFSGYLQGSGETESQGVELIGELPLFNSLQLNANYTYNDTEAADGSPRFYRPRHLANINLFWRGLDQRLALGGGIRISHDARDIDGSALDDYEVININGSFLIGAGLEIYGRVENLLDEDYQEIPPYNTSGAAAYGGVRYTF